MKLIKTVDAVGQTLCHDITQIIKDEVKDARFRKGHIVTSEDIEVLHSLGKYNIYIIDNEDSKLVHENEAANILAKMCIDDNMYASAVKEGKIDLYSNIEGLFKLNTDALYNINMFDEIIISARHNNYPVKKNDKLLGTRIIPLMIEKAKLDKVIQTNDNTKICTVLPYKIKTCAVITTGTEVYNGIIKDTFTPVIIEKLKEYGVEVIEHAILDDNLDKITNKIKEFKALEVDMIICTGGMSVDPDDLTPTAIKASGAKLISYGSPVLPGAMFLLSYFDDGTPIVGLPGCVMYSKRTVFDIVLPRLIAKDTITVEEIAKLGNGGLCFDCDMCHFPNCQFGKGL